MASRTDELIDVQPPLLPESSFIEPLSTHITEQVKRLSHFFEQTCERHPNTIALICGSSQLTYFQLDRRANRLAHLLVQRGLQVAE